MIPGVPDLAHSLVGWTMKNAGRPGLYAEAHGRAVWRLRLWPPRDSTPPMD